MLHKSVSKRTKDGKLLNNERLEFLGDSVLDLLIGEHLYKKFPCENEGFLTQLRSRIVNGENLTELTRHIGLDKLVKTRVNPEEPNVHLYGDAFEAFLGAIYLDRGFKKAGKFLYKRLMPKYLDIVEFERSNSNYKSRLLEWGQKNKRQVVFNTDLETPNSKYFVCDLRIGEEQYGAGIGISKKEAEQKAAKNALRKLGITD